MQSSWRDEENQALYNLDLPHLSSCSQENGCIKYFGQVTRQSRSILSLHWHKDVQVEAIFTPSLDTRDADLWWTKMESLGYSQNVREGSWSMAKKTFHVEVFRVSNQPLKGKSKSRNNKITVAFCDNMNLHVIVSTSGFGKQSISFVISCYDFSNCCRVMLRTNPVWSFLGWAGDLQNHRLLMAFYPEFNAPMHLSHLQTKVSVARCITSHSRSKWNDVELQVFLLWSIEIGLCCWNEGIVGN